MSQIKINNLNIAYNISGQGQVILLLHGWGVDSSYFNGLANILKINFRVVTIDLPGFGQSDMMKNPWNVDDYVNIVIDFIKSLKLEKLHLFGHSFGGRIGIKLAVKYPQILDGLILCDSAGIKPRKTFKWLFFYSLAKTGKLLLSLPLLSTFQETFRKILYKLSREQDYLKAEGMLKESLKKILAEDLKTCLKQIKIPTLIIWGKNDKYTPVNDGKIMHREIPNNDFKVVENVGHPLPRQKPEVVAAFINDFINTHD